MRKLLLLIGAAGTLGAAAHDPAAFERRRQDDLAYAPVPLVAVLANLDAFDGKRVRVSGYLTLQFENSGLALDKVSYDAGLTENSLWVNRSPWMTKDVQSRFRGRYATIYATVRASEHGHMGLYSGALADVRRIDPTFTKDDFQRYRVREGQLVLWQYATSGMFLLIVALGAVFVVACWRFGARRKA